MDVCVVGAGPGGIIAAKVFRESNDVRRIAVFERAGAIGGVWRYDGTTAMYRSLRTNLPSQCMAFPSMPMPPHLLPTTYHRSFSPGSEVLEYLKYVVMEAGLEEMLRLGQGVEKVEEVVNSEGRRKWQINGKENFDILLLCNGHYHTPNIPSLHDVDFHGEVVHSFFYDVPDPFKGKVVLLCGNGASAVDIAWEVAPLSEHFLWYHPSFSSTPPLRVPENTTIIGDLEKVSRSGRVIRRGDKSPCCRRLRSDVEFEGDDSPGSTTASPPASEHEAITELEGEVPELPHSNVVEVKRGRELPLVDVVMYATGYHFDFDFLPDFLDIRVPRKNDEERKGLEEAEEGGRAIASSSAASSNRVHEDEAALRRNSFLVLSHRMRPKSLFFFGVPHHSMPFVQLELQARAAAAIATAKSDIVAVLEQLDVFNVKIMREQFIYFQVLKHLANQHYAKAQEAAMCLSLLDPELPPLVEEYRLFRDSLDADIIRVMLPYRVVNDYRERMPNEFREFVYHDDGSVERCGEIVALPLGMER